MGDKLRHYCQIQKDHFMTEFTKKGAHSIQKSKQGYSLDATSNVIFSTSLVEKMRPTIAAYVY